MSGFLSGGGSMDSSSAAGVSVDGYTNHHQQQQNMAVDELGSRAPWRHSVAGEHASLPALSTDLKSAPALKRFGIAKERISSLFADARSLLEDSVQRLADVGDCGEDVSQLLAGTRSLLEQNRSKLNNVSEKVKSNQMKVAFFGRTSNGKSSVINAMLRDRILPSGIGHTTSCFCCVEGTGEGTPYLQQNNSPHRQSVQTVQQLAHSLHNEKLESRSLVKVYWPREKCAMLRDDVVLLDSPGIDISPDLDTWIDTHCTDADVFVLVANAESTLMQTEKNFFHKLSQISSKPNIFILNNRWDASATEPEMMEEVRKQHLQRNLEFLCDELQVSNRDEGMDRVFFISAKEVLHLRMVEQGKTSSVIPLADGYRLRLQEFERFEKSFGECISSHAIRTKFGEPARAGLNMASHLQDSLANFKQQIIQLREGCETSLRECRDSLQTLRREAEACRQEWNHRIQHMRSHAQDQVATAVSNELRRLWSMVEQFDSPVAFQEQDTLAYKMELCEHISANLGQQLLTNCSQQLSRDCVAAQQEMFDRLQRVIPPAVAVLSSTMFIRPSFRITHDLDIVNLCSDFEADLRFQFRFGWTALIQWLAGGGSVQRFTISAVPALMRTASISGRSSSSRTSHDVEAGSMSSFGLPPGSAAAGSAAVPDGNTAAQNAAMVQSLQSGMMMASSVAAQAPWLMVGVGVLMFKVVGWRVVVSGVGIYGSLYGYERICWTTRAKERAFKEQVRTRCKDRHTYR
eukprot:scpid46070/ scgid2087/ Mitofusin-2; Transmembrane GTPase MFN2